VRRELLRNRVPDVPGGGTVELPRPGLHGAEILDSHATVIA
jgi:hypothetical protein